MPSEALIEILIFDLIAWFWLNYSIRTILVLNFLALIYVNRRFLKLAVETFPRDFK